MKNIKTKWLSLNNKQTINKFLIIAAVLLQVILLFSIQIRKEISLRSGKIIIVKIIPVDPRSVFRGDYINLNYEFSRLDLNKVKHDKAYFSRGQKVFVKLSKTDDEWKAIQVSGKYFRDVGVNEMTLAGSISGWPSKDAVNIVYGIESYFVPEGKGKYIEGKIADKRIKAEISIDNKGYASVCKIFINEEEVKFR